MLKNGVPEVLVSDNAAEFHDTTLCQQLKKIVFLPYKTSLYNCQSYEAVKMGLKAYSTSRGLLSVYLSRMLLSYTTIPHKGKSRSPSEMMASQLRFPLTMSFKVNHLYGIVRNLIQSQNQHPSSLNLGKALPP